MNESIRAWNLLKPDERPRGMEIRAGGDWTENYRHAEDYVVRDRLIVAVGNVNQKQYGLAEVWFSDEWQWWSIDKGDTGWGSLAASHDQLKAANDALEAIRKDVQP